MGSPPHKAVATTELASVPMGFVSYAHGGANWDALVLDFASALRTVGGIDADLDQWHLVGGQDWAAYGPAAIEASDYILLAVSPAYKDAWQRKNKHDRNAGAAREAATVKGLFDRDQADFQRRVRIVLLPGSSTQDIPLDLLATVERFEVPSMDLLGLEKLLRSILALPAHERPALGPLPALPAHTLAQIASAPGTPDLAPGPHDAASEAADDDHLIAERLAARLAKIDHDIASPSIEEPAGDFRGGASPTIQDERSAVKASLEAVERTLPIGAARQRMVGDYLRSQLYFSAGAYHAAEARLNAVRARLGDQSEDPEDRVFEPSIRELTEVMNSLNERMRARRYATVPRNRHPKPPDMTLDPATVRDVRTFYEVTRGAMSEPPPEEKSLRIIRKATLLGRADKHAPGFYQRFTAQQTIAREPLGLAPLSPQADAGGVLSLIHADLGGENDGVASSVLKALAKAHLDLHLVERRRSGPVGAILKRGRDEVDGDRALLRRSIVLNTFALAITESLPWMFAANEAERKAAQSDPKSVRRDLTPTPAVWRARQVTMLALYRRSHGFRLLGDHERAYNDLRILQRLGRLTRQARKDDQLVAEWVDTLDALAEYRIGELYRADHDYMQALIQLCRSHDCVQALERRPWPIAHEVGHLEIKLSLGKGKAFFEIGAMKRSLKWHLTAWRWLLAFEQPHPEVAQAMMEIEGELDRMKHNPVLPKDDLQAVLGPVVEQMCAVEIRDEHHARAADILVRISHLLSVLRLREDSGETPSNLDTAALRCLRRAAELDEHNLLVQTGLLRYELRRPGSIAHLRTPDPMSCWPSGATSVDQVIRVAEHLMLERLHAAGGPTETGRKGVARALMGHFMTHTDSINLRGAILHKYLMRRRAEDREPWWADEDSDDRGLTRLGAAGGSAPYLEFVCLRRFGSFTPFMPRPAAVSAVGGGYLVRIARPSAQNRGGHPRMFNIVVDPGEGAVNNLYAMGLSISDIDMVIATHDHPEHLAALDAILSLRRELHQRERARPEGAARGRGPDARLLILGNRSVVNRYSFLNGDGSHLVQHIADASLLASSRYPAGLTIDDLPTEHTDGGRHSACGFVLALESDHPEGGMGHLAITFMSDTAIGGLHEGGDPSKPLDKRWGRALAADIVVAHASDVPSGELRELADLPAVDDEDPIAHFDAGVRSLAAEHPADASQLMHALSLVPPDTDADPLPVSLMSRGAVDGGQQLYLAGLLEVCHHMRQAPTASGREARILIVGELSEQLGSFRGTIAREINTRMLNLPQIRHTQPPPPLIALTADIGLRIRLTPTTKEDGEVVGRNTVLCSTCSYNNDRLDSERFHPPQDIYDVCVKGDHEAMYWNCDIHDPGMRSSPLFVEQMGGYNPFAAGGRYHG